jgi:hypothetical protein
VGRGDRKVSAAQVRPRPIGAVEIRVGEVAAGEVIGGQLA